MLTNEYAERNKEIYASRKLGETYRSIGERYGVTPSRIMEICNRERRREHKRKEMGEARVKNNDYLIDELFPEGTPQSSRIQHCLKRAGIKYLSDLINFVGSSQEDGYKSLMMIRNFGERSLDIVIAKVEEVTDNA